MRCIEFLACGRIEVTTPSPLVDSYSKDYFYAVRKVLKTAEVFASLKLGRSADDLARAEAGARYILAEHTWAHRLKDIARVVGL
jgi:hypothetical protein